MAIATKLPSRLLHPERHLTHTSWILECLYIDKGITEPVDLDHKVPFSSLLALWYREATDSTLTTDTLIKSPFRNGGSHPKEPLSLPLSMTSSPSGGSQTLSHPGGPGGDRQVTG